MVKKQSFVSLLLMVLISIFVFSACEPISESIVGDSTTAEVTKECKHDYSVLISDTSTCESNGFAVYQCSKCAETIETQSNAKGHIGTMKCSRCNGSFLDMLAPNLSKAHFLAKDDKEELSTNLSFTLNSGTLIIKATTNYSHSATNLLDYTCETVFTIQKDGSWYYALDGKSNSSSIRWNCSFTGLLDSGKLYLFTKDNIQDHSFELPYSNIKGDQNYAKAMYLILKLQFSYCVKQLEEVCSLQQFVDLKNLGFTQY